MSKLVAKCLERRLGLVFTIEPTFPSICRLNNTPIYPCALADEFGNSNKLSKCTWTDKTAYHYLSAAPPVLTPSLPHGWVPNTVFN